MNKVVIAIAVCLSLIAQPSARAQTVAPHALFSQPTVTITTTTADSTAANTTGAHEAHVYWKFGTVAGSFGTCTAQAKTSIDGTNYLTLGSAVSLAATTGTGTAWSLIGQNGTTSVTTSSSSTTVALSFGKFTKFTFACNSYGTSAPVTISVIYR